MRTEEALVLPPVKSFNTFNASGYACTNEEPERYHELLKGRTFKRALSICSGGEVPLFVLLPRTTKELVLVDHAKKALRVTYMKCLTLNKYGPAETKKFFSTVVNSRDLLAKLEGLWKYVPNDIKVPGVPGNVAEDFSYEFTNLNREWKLAREVDLRASLKKLHLLKFIHGDLMDAVIEHGAFEILYFSNAFEHSGRSGKMPVFDEVSKLVEPGGYILTACGTELEDNYYLRQQIAKNPFTWKKVKTVPGLRGTWKSYGFYQTHYGLFQVPMIVCKVCGGFCEAQLRKLRTERSVFRPAIHQGEAK